VQSLDIFDEIAFPGILRVSAVNLFWTATIRLAANICANGFQR